MRKYFTFKLLIALLLAIQLDMFAGDSQGVVFRRDAAQIG